MLMTSLLMLTLSGPMVSPGYSPPPQTLDAVYINNVIAAAYTYGGGGTLPSRPFTMTGIRFVVRTAGATGSTNNTFRASDGTNTCDCVMACNQTTGAKRATCTSNAGTGCAFPASAALSYSFPTLGDCVTPMDVNGNLSVEGFVP